MALGEQFTSEKHLVAEVQLLAEDYSSYQARNCSWQCEYVHTKNVPLRLKNARISTPRYGFSNVKFTYIFAKVLSSVTVDCTTYTIEFMYNSDVISKIKYDVISFPESTTGRDSYDTDSAYTYLLLLGCYSALHDTYAKLVIF